LTLREQRRERWRSSRDEEGAGLRRAQEGVVLAFDFHLQNFLGLLVGANSGVGQEREKPVLEGAEAPFEFAFGLRGGSHQMGDAESLEGSLELAFWVFVVVG